MDDIAARRSRLFTRLSCLGHGANDTYWFVLPIILPLILEHFGLRYAGAGGILTGFLITIALCSIVAGRLSDRFPRRIFVYLGFFAASGGLLIAAFTDRIVPFSAFVLVAAVGVSTYHPVIYALINDTVTERRGKVFAQFEFTGLATLLGVMFISGLLLRSIGWRAVLIMATLPGFIIGVLFMAKGKRLPLSQHHGAGDDTPAKLRVQVSVFVLFLAAVSLRQLTVTAALNFAPTYLVKAMGLSPTFATYITACYFAGGMVVTYLISRVIDRSGPFLIMHAATLIMAPLIAALSFRIPLWSAPLVFLAFGGVASAAMPAQNLILTKMAGTTGKGQAFGLLMGITTITASLSPGIFGVLADTTGLQATMRMVSVPALLSWILLFLLHRTSGRWSS